MFELSIAVPGVKLARIDRGAGRTGGFTLDGRWHVEKHMIDVARLVEAHQALHVRFDLVFCETRAKRITARNGSLLRWWCAPHALRF
jgi:hypothetical protein